MKASLLTTLAAAAMGSKLNFKSTDGSSQCVVNYDIDTVDFGCDVSVGGVKITDRIDNMEAKIREYVCPEHGTPSNANFHPTGDRDDAKGWCRWNCNANYHDEDDNRSCDSCKVANDCSVGYEHGGTCSTTSDKTCTQCPSIPNGYFENKGDCGYNCNSNHHDADNNRECTKCKAATDCFVGYQHGGTCAKNSDYTCTACTAISNGYFTTLGNCNFECNANYHDEDNNRSCNSCKVASDCAVGYEHGGTCSTGSDKTCTQCPAIPAANGQYDTKGTCSYNCNTYYSGTNCETHTPPTPAPTPPAPTPWCVSIDMPLVQDYGATISVGAASATGATVLGRASLAGADKHCQVKKFFPHPDAAQRMQAVNAEHTTAGHDLWTMDGTQYVDDKVSGHEEVGQVFTTCPYVTMQKADGSRALTSVLTVDCNLPSATFEALWEPVMLIHMNYLMGDTEMGAITNTALHGLCGFANQAFAEAGAVNKNFYIAMWPHFECWASAMQWQKAGANGYWHKHLKAIATEFNIEKEVPTASSYCSGDPKDYINSVDGN